MGADEVFSHQTVRLAAGRHAAPGPDGVCAMELASMLAGEPFSDRPRSVSRSLAAAMRGYNDGLDDRRRQQLVPLAAACVGTRVGWREERRQRAALGLHYRSARAVGREVAATDDDTLHACVLDRLGRAAALQAEAAAAPQERGDARAPAPER